MARADDTFSTIVWIWLREALDLAAASLGSMALAKELLIEWLAAEKLPWFCMAWKALDAEGIARLEKQIREARMISFLTIPLPSTAYHESEPEFWRAGLRIDWGDNMAREYAVDGAKALGIKVSREHLLALLPDEGEEVRGAGAWMAVEAKRMKDANEIPSKIRISEFARELEQRMARAAASDKSVRPIKAKSIENMLRDWGLWPIASIK
jgi:hypothetical protein